MKKTDQNVFKDLRAEEEKQRKLLEQTMNELMEIEENIYQLKKETNIGSIEEIIKAFKEYEDTNASLTKHIKDLDTDVFFHLLSRLKKWRNKLRILNKKLNNIKVQVQWVRIQ